MTENIIYLNDATNEFVWGPVMLCLLLGTGILLSIKTNFIQVTKFNYIIKHTVGALFTKNQNTTSKNSLTPLQAVTTALAGTIGTGNIAGVTGAIFIGGPGALFWMWFAAFFGMATKYSEILLAMKYRETKADGSHIGGPMYSIRNGLGQKWHLLAVFFTICGGLASFGMGNIAQSSEIAGALLDAFNVPRLISAIALMAIIAFAVLGGVKRIGTITSYLVPFMALFYVIAGVILIAMRITEVPAALLDVFQSAFSFKSVEGGIMGTVIMQAMKYGFERGTFSNEAGLGSAPMAHATSSTEEPCEQAMLGVFEVFVCSMIICTITALAILVSGVTNTPGGLDYFPSNGAVAITAFNTVFANKIGGYIIELSLVFFALSTILSWSYYGECCWGYLSNNNIIVNRIYKILFIATCYIGSCGSGSLMWKISDTLNGMMALPNLVSLILLSNVVSQETKKYFDTRK